MKNKKSGLRLLVCALVVAVALSAPLSWAKLARRQKIPLELALARPVVFEAGYSHRFEAPDRGYYAFQLWGGAGGDSLNVYFGEQLVYPIGGPGGYAAAVLYLEAGTVLDITVGGAGDIITGGFNGGGWGGSLYVPVFGDYFGGGGGGATDVRPEGGSLEDRLLVAGGGGGGSGGNSGSQAPDGSGGAGGSPGSGLDGLNGEGSGHGWGGTLQSGGEGAHWGEPGRGGDGAHSGGGGGGGYFGGGGAYGSTGGGGGGASFVAEGLGATLPTGIPGREAYPDGFRSGLAVVTYLGNVG